MNIGDITVIISVLAGMAAIPFAASSITVADDYNYGFATVLNSTPEFAANFSSTIPSLISKTVSDEGIKYIYRTPYGEYSIFISPEKFEETLLKAGKKVSSLQSSSEQVWELSMPSESLIINHNNQKIIETYRNLNGYLRITTENGWVSQNKSGTASEEELLAGMLRLEKEMNETISLMKSMSEKILNASAEVQSASYNVNITAINATAEWVQIRNFGAADLNMDGWTLSDASSHIYGFTDFNLSAGGYVKVRSGSGGSGANNATDLYWTTSTIWNDAGDTATLKDSSGRIVTTKSY